MKCYNNEIIILMSTYNGEKYLKEQIDSLYNQTYTNFRIITRDDISNDNSLEILRTYDLEIIPSLNNVGAKNSFSALLEYAVNNTKSNYFMFCDQDDIWEQDKIERTLKKMKEIEDNDSKVPILIHTDLKVVDESLNNLSDSFMLFQNIDPKYNKLNNLLIQNTITGCTMMINRKLADICLPIPSECIMHDWWIGLVASKFGKITYLDKSTISYRQHTRNCVGAKKFNLKYIVQNIFKEKVLTDNISQVKIYLDIYRNELDSKSIEMLEEFSSIESKSFLKKRQILFKYKLFKQGFIRNIGLLVKI